MYIELLEKSEKNQIKTFVETYLGYNLSNFKFMNTSAGERVVKISIYDQNLLRPMNFEFSDYSVRALRSGSVKAAKKLESSLEIDWHNFLGFKFANYIPDLNNWLDSKKLTVY